MVVEVFDVLNTILEISSRQLCYYCVKDELEEVGGAHGSQSDYNCRAAGDSPSGGCGEPPRPVGTDTVFSLILEGIS